MKTLVIVIPILLFACNSNTGKTKTEPNDLITAEDIKADSKVAMEISGMTCEMGCVSTIRNHVTQMKGTTNFEMDFDKERATDFATIEFDSRLLSKDDIKEEIEMKAPLRI